MGQTVTAYLTRIRNRVGDLGVRQALPDANLPLALEEALAAFSKDRPRTATFTATGNSTTYSYDLTADATQPWIPDWSRLLEIEYPAGERKPELVELREATERDGTVTLHDLTPNTGEQIKLRYTTTWPFPTDDPDDDLIPAIFFPAITALAAGNIAHGLAVEAARKQTKTVATTVVDLDSGQLFAAAAELRKTYETIVLGRPSSGADARPQIAYAVTDVDVFRHSFFHQRATDRD